VEKRGRESILIIFFVSRFLHPFPMTSTDAVCFFGNYIGSSDNIDDPNEPIRLGQLPTHHKISKDGRDVWLATTCADIFDTNWMNQGTERKTLPIVGKHAYEVKLNVPSHELVTSVFSDATQKKQITTTGLIMGTVIAVMEDNHAIIKCSEEWIHSTRFQKDQRPLVHFNKQQTRIAMQDLSGKQIFKIRSTECFDYLEQEGVTLQMAKER
jgi:hypothetical protein